MAEMATTDPKRPRRELVIALVGAVLALIATLSGATVGAVATLRAQSNAQVAEESIAREAAHRVSVSNYLDAANELLRRRTNVTGCGTFTTSRQRAGVFFRMHQAKQLEDATDVSGLAVKLLTQSALSGELSGALVLEAERAESGAYSRARLLDPVEKLDDALKAVHEGLSSDVFCSREDQISKGNGPDTEAERAIEHLVGVAAEELN